MDCSGLSAPRFRSQNSCQNCTQYRESNQHQNRTAFTDPSEQERKDEDADGDTGSACSDCDALSNRLLNCMGPKPMLLAINDG